MFSEADNHSCKNAVVYAVVTRNNVGFLYMCYNMKVITVSEILLWGTIW